MRDPTAAPSSEPNASNASATHSAPSPGASAGKRDAANTSSAAPIGHNVARVGRGVHSATPSAAEITHTKPNTYAPSNGSGACGASQALSPKPMAAAPSAHAKLRKL